MHYVYRCQMQGGFILQLNNVCARNPGMSHEQFNISKWKWWLSVCLQDSWWNRWYVAVAMHHNISYIGTAYREYGLVYKGYNFNETHGVASLDECIQMCKDSARCKFWWYEFKNNQRCCLKEGKSGKLLWGPGFVAGNKPWCSKCVKLFFPDI